LNKKPDQPLDPLITNLIRFILSKDGRLLAIKADFYPAPNAIRLQSLKSLWIAGSLGIAGDAS
jgi:phosphate transport system substrate-binding protein